PRLATWARGPLRRAGALRLPFVSSNESVFVSEPPRADGAADGFAVFSSSPLKPSAQIRTPAVAATATAAKPIDRGFHFLGIAPASYFRRCTRRFVSSPSPCRVGVPARGQSRENVALTSVCGGAFPPCVTRQS